MKMNTNEEISFTNCSSGLHLSKSEGAIAVDFKSSEVVLYLNTSLYQAFAWLIVEASDAKELMDYVNWTFNPKATPKNTLLEIHGPNHSVCLACSPKHERVQLNFEIGISIDLKFNDFKGLIDIVKEAQNDLDWRRQLLQWGYCKEENSEYHQKDRKIS